MATKTVANKITERRVFQFGEFRFHPVERRLQRGNHPLNLGGRALDILTVLVEAAPKTVSNRDLMSKVWGRVHVEPGNLRFHVAALRKALGDSSSFIRNVSGKGYCFVQPLSQLTADDSPLFAGDYDFNSPLPRLPHEVIGRAQAVREIVAEVSVGRQLTIVGAGGIGKTTVAIAAAHSLRKAFNTSVCFLDLGLISDPNLIAGTLARGLGLQANSENPVSAILTSLRAKRTLLVFDGCEHVIEAAARLVDAIYKDAPHTHVLATSRESLRLENERIYRLPPLENPPDTSGLTANEAGKSSAVQLFCSRMAFSSGRAELTDLDAPDVAQICLRLDGIPLALELAAGHVEAFGIRGIAKLLETQLPFHWRNFRTVRPRHQTLSAVLDWSYNLLSDFERTVLHALSALNGYFSLDAAQAIVAAEHALTSEAVAMLYEKSLLSTKSMNGIFFYRLLDTTRAYALEKAEKCGELEQIRARHANHYLKLLEALDPGMGSMPRNESTALFGEHVDNVRAALQWSFSKRGDISLAVALAAAATPMFLQLSLLVECRAWCELALKVIERSTADPARQLRLQIALGNSLMFTRGNTEDVQAALDSALELAEGLGEAGAKLRTLALLNMFFHRLGDFKRAFIVAERANAVAEAQSTAGGMRLANSLLAVCLHFTGSQSSAESRCRAAVGHDEDESIEGHATLGIEPQLRALAVFARVLWLRGDTDSAGTTATQAIVESEAFGHIPYICMVHLYTLPLFLWMDDYARAEWGITIVSDIAKKHDLLPYQSDVLGFQGQIAARKGDYPLAINLLERALHLQAQARHPGLLATMFAINLGEALFAAGRGARALPLIDDAIAKVEIFGDWYHLPEMLRVKANLLARTQPSSSNDAERIYLRSLEIARRIEAPAWEARTASSLASYRRERGAQG